MPVEKVFIVSNQEHTALHGAFLDKRDKARREGMYSTIFGQVEGSECHFNRFAWWIVKRTFRSYRSVLKPAKGWSM